jgi:hypothetical protein
MARRKTSTAPPPGSAEEAMLELELMLGPTEHTVEELREAWPFHKAFVMEASYGVPWAYTEFEDQEPVG